MRRNLIIILIICLITCSCDLRTADQYYDLAYELEEKGKYSEAIPYLDKAIEKRPDFKPALLNRGADKSILKNYKGAIEDYKQILKYDSDNTYALLNIGNNYKRLKDYEESITYYTRALNTKGAIRNDSTYLVINIPNEWESDSDYYVRQYEIQYERGISYVYEKKYALAIADLLEALKYVDDYPNAMSWLGEAYYYSKDTLNARKYLTKASEYGMLDAEELLKELEDND
ncbi:MAG: hypothetical protein COA88_16055 [Kordia sp.]|nr:MAG: hypothetical protein COA88_16055 [Kordia sp.]